jgi:hypothetical protein
MNGPGLLEHAAGLVNRRRREYGELVDLFEQVAQRWSLTLGTKVSLAQVALCLVDLKLARLARDPKHLERRAKPNKVRGRQVEGVREVDPDGRIVVHHRIVDTLGRMFKAGTIDQAMHDAGPALRFFTGASKRNGKMTKLVVPNVHAEEHRDIRRAQDRHRYGISINVANCIITGGNVDDIEETPSVWADGANYMPSRNTGRKLLRSPQICAR